MEICFNLTPCEETGGYVARWDDPAGGGISTQGESFADLEMMVRDAVDGYFTDRKKPERIRLHFVRDPELYCRASGFVEYGVGTLLSPSSLLLRKRSDNKIASP